MLLYFSEPILPRSLIFNARMLAFSPANVASYRLLYTPIFLCHFAQSAIAKDAGPRVVSRNPDAVIGHTGFDPDQVIYLVKCFLAD